MHRLLNRCDGGTDEVRDYLVEHLGDPNVVLIVDDPGSLKNGVRSASVQRHYLDTAVGT